MQLRFLEPYLRGTHLNEAIRTLYRGTLRVLLLLLHDFPEFLCQHHFSLCDTIPAGCIQMRNLVLSAFPRAMRLPDPFTPQLKVDQLPEMLETPLVQLPDWDTALGPLLRSDTEAFLAKALSSDASKAFLQVRVVYLIEGGLVEGLVAGLPQSGGVHWASRGTMSGRHMAQVHRASFWAQHR